MPLTEANSPAANGGAVDGSGAGNDGAGGEEGASTTVTKNIVLSDGTYATQTTVVGACLIMLLRRIMIVFFLG